MTYDLTAQQSIGIAIIALALLVFGFAFWRWYDNRRQHSEDQAMRETWEKEIKGVTLPDYNGDTWDWPAGGLAEYFFGSTEATAQHPTPPWGDAYDFDTETDMFILSMRERTTQFITALSQPQPALAGGR